MSKILTTFNVEYWINKGYSELEAKEKVKEIQSNISIKCVETKRGKFEIYLQKAKDLGYGGKYAEKIAIELRRKDKKYSSPMCVDFWVKKGMTEDEAKYKIKSQRKNNKEYWIEKGFNIEEAEKMVSEYQQDQCKKVKNRGDSLRIQHWIDRGFSEEEAKEKLKERQTTFSLEICIEKYGQVEGTKIWKERQIKWQNTLNNKPQEEIDRINKSKANTLQNYINKYGEIEGPKKYVINLERVYSFYSNISQELFYNILENIPDKENVKFATHNKEKTIYNENRAYMYDFCYNKSIIEFNGDVYHANPTIFNENDTPHPFNDLSSKEIWQLDNIKNDVAKNKGYKVLVVWEKDYRENREKILNECLNFIN